MKKQLFKTFVAVLAIAAAAAGPVRGQNASPDVTLDFTTNSWGIPAGKSNTTYAANSYTSGDYTITLKGGGSSSNGYYFHSNGYLLLGKTDAYLQLPAFSSAVDSIQVVGTSGASTSVTQNIYVDENNSWMAVSTQTTGMQNVTQTYVINENYRAAGNIYFIKVDNSYSTQITYIKVYYAGGSTPTPGQTPAGENIFQYCYDCQRNPAYPKTTGSASLSGFQNPFVGYAGTGIGSNNTSAGPWKLEYMGLWSSTNNYGIYSVYSYQNTYNCTDVPVFRLYQWNPTANEYQHAAYGVVCCYAKVSNAVEHTALFVSEGGLGCVLTNSSHSSSMNITFDEDLKTGLTILITAAAPAAEPITCTLEDVGKVLCSDGSIYATADAASADSKTAVAMITYLDVTTHKGLAMSLTDVSTGSSFCSQNSVTCLANGYSTEAAAKGDMDGLANTAALVAHATHTHGAANVAANYNVARPEGASAWFLPSAGQWDRMATAAGGYESLQSKLGLASSNFYWSSSERNFYNAWAISFTSSQPLGNYAKTNTLRVRACFEFDANILVPHTVRFAAGNDGWQVQDVTASASATAPAILQNVMAGDSLVVTAPATLNRKVKGVKAVKYAAVESIELNLQSTTIAKASTLSLTATVLPENATNKSVTWSSSNTGVASVDQTGKVTAHASGTANIIATANDGSGVADTCVVSVMNSASIDGVQLNYVAGDNWQAVVTRNSTVLSIGDNNKVRLTEGNVYLDFNGQSVDGASSFNPANASNYHWLRHFNVWIASRDIYYFQGETWATAIQNHSQNSSLDWSTNSTYVIYDNLQYLTDENNDGAPVNPNSVINPSGSYSSQSLDD